MISPHNEWYIHRKCYGLCTFFFKTSTWYLLFMLYYALRDSLDFSGALVTLRDDVQFCCFVVENMHKTCLNMKRTNVTLHTNSVYRKWQCIVSRVVWNKLRVWRRGNVNRVYTLSSFCIWYKEKQKSKLISRYPFTYYQPEKSLKIGKTLSLNIIVSLSFLFIREINFTVNCLK